MRNFVWSKTRPCFEYWTPNGDATVTLGVDGVVAVLIEDGEVIEWFTNDTPRETVENFAGDATELHFRACAVDADVPAVRWALAWRNLVADNRGMTVDVITAT